MRDNSKSCEIAEAGSLSPSPSLDLIDQMAEEDAKGEDRFAFDEQKFEVKDLVEAVYDGKMANAHSDFCDYRPYVNHAGIIFCLTCGSTVGSTVGSINDSQDAFYLHLLGPLRTRRSLPDAVRREAVSVQELCSTSNINPRRQQMSTNKTTPKVATVRGNTYVLTAIGKTQLAEISGQGRMIRETLKKPMTAAEVVSHLGKRLGAPNPAKTVAFYLSVWRGAGFVKFGPKGGK